MSTSLILSNKQELRRFLPQDIVYIKASGNYIFIYTAYKEEIIYTMQLGKVADAIADQLEGQNSDFIFVGRSYIVNSNYITHIKPKNNVLMLRDYRGNPHEIQGINPDALHKLMDHVTNEAERRKQEND